MPDNREQSAAWDSEKKLNSEEKTLIGDEAEDRNLTGSTTYVTLPDQEENQSGQKPANTGKPGSSNSGNSSRNTGNTGNTGNTNNDSKRS